MDNVTITIISTAIAAVIGALGTYVVSVRKQRDETVKTANEQAFTVYKELTDRMKKDYQDIVLRYIDLDKDYISYREKYAEVRKENEYLRKENAELEEIIKNLRNDT